MPSNQHLTQSIHEAKFYQRFGIFITELVVNSEHICALNATCYRILRKYCALGRTGKRLYASNDGHNGVGDELCQHTT